MVYYKTGKGAKRKKVGVSIGMGPVKITSSRPSLRNQVKNVKKSVKEIQSKDELKYLDTFIGGTSITNTPLLTLLNGMQQGDTVSTRQGDSITPTSIQYRCRVVQSPTALSDVIFRHLILWDRQPNGAAPTATDILDTTLISEYTVAPYQRQYQKRFKILHDKVIKLSPAMADPTAPTTQVLQPFSYKQFKKALSRVVNYRRGQNAGTVADIASNSLYSLWVAQSAASAGTVICGYRMYYKDD